jgi:hypothetical protein
MLPSPGSICRWRNAKIERAIQRVGNCADNFRLRLQESRLPLNLNGLLAEDSETFVSGTN